VDTETRVNQNDKSSKVRPVFPPPRHFRADAGDAGLLAYDEYQPEIGVYAVRCILFDASFMENFTVVISEGVVEIT